MPEPQFFETVTKVSLLLSPAKALQRACRLAGVSLRSAPLQSRC